MKNHYESATSLHISITKPQRGERASKGQKEREREKTENLSSSNLPKVPPTCLKCTNSLYLLPCFLSNAHTHSRKRVEKVQLSARLLDISHCSISPVLCCQHNRLEALKTVVLEEQEKKRVKHKKSPFHFSFPPTPAPFSSPAKTLDEEPLCIWKCAVIYVCMPCWFHYETQWLCSKT